MAKSYPTQLNPGAFLPTTDIFDVSYIYELEVSSNEFKELIVRLRQSVNDTALIVNIKDSGYYSLEEFLNGQLFFPNPSLSSSTPQTPVFRQVFRKVINFGALPDTSSKLVAHNIPIDQYYTFTRIYGTATTPSTSFIPLPYASPTVANAIELSVDATNVTITTGTNRSTYTTTYVVIEYIKQ